MRINGYSLGPGYPQVHTALIDTVELEEAIDWIVEEIQAFEATGRVFTTITLEIEED